MPELPDLSILADALDAALTGRPVIGAATPQSLVLRGTPAELKALGGQELVDVRRRGKFLTFRFERDRLVVNAMLTGRIGLAPPGARPFPQTAAVIGFGPRAREPHSVAGRGGPVPEWVAGAEWLPAPGESTEMRYRDATRMGKLYLLPSGVDRPVAGWDEQGPDADDQTLAVTEWRERIRRHNGELKNVLRNQALVAGIGNAYSDEILWAARLAPFRARASLASDEVDRLYAAMKEVLGWAIGELRERVPPRLELEQRSFLRVHGKGGQPCPRCGATISEVKAGGFVTNWCRACQR